jgi:putative DNA primase/helicase
VRAFLMALLHPTGPYVCLALAGEQGSAKSCAARYIRSIVDPSDTPTTGAPKDVETAYLQANMNWCPVFDNVHEVRQWLADVLCQLCTGAGYTKRTHFENVDMWTLKAKRPFILTSIADAITQSDLLERTMTVRLPAIPKGSRRDERTLDAEFATARPGILGALLDAVVLALKDSPSVVIPELPRMADIAQWVQAAEPALGQTPGDFVRALAGNQVDSYQAVLEANLVAQAVIKLMQYQKRLEGTSSQIAEMLKNVMLDRESMRPPLGWPRTPAAITSQLKLAVPALRDREGIEIDFGRDKHAARITISKGGDGVDGVERNRKFSLLEDEAMEAAFHR